jgi:hypothetical protein
MTITFVSTVGSLLLWALVSADELCAAPGSPGITGALVEEVERHVVMPANAKPLDAYDRYYVRDRALIKGVYVLRTGSFSNDYRFDRVPVSGVLNAFTMANLPLIFDGGCSVVNVTFNVDNKAVSASCNGHA